MENPDVAVARDMHSNDLSPAATVHALRDGRPPLHQPIRIGKGGRLGYWVWAFAVNPNATMTAALVRSGNAARRARNIILVVLSGSNDRFVGLEFPLSTLFLCSSLRNAPMAALPADSASREALSRRWVSHHPTFARELETRCRQAELLNRPTRSIRWMNFFELSQRPSGNAFVSIFVSAAPQSCRMSFAFTRSRKRINFKDFSSAC